MIMIITKKLKPGMKRSAIRNIIFYIAFITFAFLIIISPSFALDVERKVLDNGLTLLVVQRHNLPVVKVTVGIQAGNLLEPEEKAGLANLTATLLTGGTSNRTAQQINEEIEFVGGSVGAGGGDDYISVSLSVLKKDINLGFDLLSDIILHPSFPEDELSKKKERIKGSLKAQEEDPGFIASREFRKEIFGSHPYGRLVTGTAETLDNVNREDLLQFHTEYYAPDNSVMAVVGDISADEVGVLFSKYFANWQIRNVAMPPVPRPDKPKERKTVKVDKDLTQANIILGHTGVSRDDPDYYSISVMNYILGSGGFASRLMQNIREEKGLVYDIHSFFAAEKYGGRFQVGLQTKNESANQAIEEILKEIKRIRTENVSDTEINDAKLFLTGSFPMRIETSRRIASFLVAVEYFDLGAEYIDNYPSYINRVTKADVLRVAKKYLDPVKFTLVVVADQEKAQLRKDFK